MIAPWQDKLRLGFVATKNPTVCFKSGLVCGSRPQ